MKRVSTFQLCPGMVVAENVLSFDRQLIMAQGTVLTDKLITKLDLYGIFNVMIEDEKPAASEPAAPEPAVPEPAAPDPSAELSFSERVKSSAIYQEFKEDYELQVDSLKDALNNVVERNVQLDVKTLLNKALDMMHKTNDQFSVLDMLQNMKEYDDSTFTHCMNVGLICNVLAKWLKLNDEQIEMATACGLFHDIGKLLISRDIITKPGKLSALEYAQIQKHPILGYQLLQKQNVNHHIMNAALMHHERSDGSGYPMRLSGEQIDRYARIVAIADVYDAMTAARCYRGPLCPFRVIEIFEQEGFRKYDVEYLLVFLENVVNTYIQNRCRLSDGRTAEIVFVNREKLSKPMVKCGEDYVNLLNTDITIEELL